MDEDLLNRNQVNYSFDSFADAYMDGMMRYRFRCLTEHPLTGERKEAQVSRDMRPDARYLVDLRKETRRRAAFDFMEWCLDNGVWPCAAPTTQWYRYSAKRHDWLVVD